MVFCTATGAAPERWLIGLFVDEYVKCLDVGKMASFNMRRTIMFVFIFSVCGRYRCIAQNPHVFVSCGCNRIGNVESMVD